MRRAILVISLFSISAAPAVFAQAPRGQGSRVPNINARVQRQVQRLTTLLDLTPGEQSSLTDLLTKNATANQPLMSSMRTAQQALHAAEKNNDSAGVQSASTQIGTITGQMTANRSALNMGIASILTPDQLSKYKALGPERGGWGFGPGHGPGPGGAAGPGGIGGSR